MSEDEGSLGITARLVAGVIAAVVVNIVCIEITRLRESLYLVPWVLTALVVVWVVSGAARDDGGIRKAGIWALLGIALASACVTLFFVFAIMIVYMIMVHPPGP